MAEGIHAVLSGPPNVLIPDQTSVKSGFTDDLSKAKHTRELQHQNKTRSIINVIQGPTKRRPKSTKKVKARKRGIVVKRKKVVSTKRKRVQRRKKLKQKVGNRDVVKKR